MLRCGTSSMKISSPLGQRETSGGLGREKTSPTRRSATAWNLLKTPPPRHPSQGDFQRGVIKSSILGLWSFFSRLTPVPTGCEPSEGFGDSHAESVANSPKSKIKAQVDVIFLRHGKPESASERWQ